MSETALSAPSPAGRLSSHPNLAPLMELAAKWATGSAPVATVLAVVDDDKAAADPTIVAALNEALAAAIRPLGAEAKAVEVKGGAAAIVPNAVRETLISAANDARQAFSKRTGKYASFGFAIATKESGDRLFKLSERASLRAKSFGGNYVAEAPKMLAVIGRLTPLMHATKGVLARLDVDVERHDNPEDAVEMLSRERPAVAVVNLLGPRHLLDQIAALRKQPEHVGMHVVLVTNKGPETKYEDIAARVPGATLVQGEVRLVPRVIEVVSQLLGLRPRRHLRVDPATNVQVTAIEESGGAGITVMGRMIDISESGAKLSVNADLKVDQRVALAFKLETSLLTVRGEVARRYVNTTGEREVGIRFEELSADTAKAISDFVRADLRLNAPGAEAPPAQAAPTPEPEPAPEATRDEFVRATPRVRLPKPLTLKARLKAQNGKQVAYLKLVDLSEGGFMLVAPRKLNPPFTVGHVVDALIFGEGVSLHCTAEVMRKTKPDLDSNWTLGMRFLGLTRQARSEHAKALYRLKA